MRHRLLGRSLSRGNCGADVGSSSAVAGSSLSRRSGLRSRSGLNSSRTRRGRRTRRCRSRRRRRRLNLQIRSDPLNQSLHQGAGAGGVGCLDAGGIRRGDRGVLHTRTDAEVQQRARDAIAQPTGARPQQAIYRVIPGRLKVAQAQRGHRVGDHRGRDVSHHAGLQHSRPQERPQRAHHGADHSRCPGDHIVEHVATGEKQRLTRSADRIRNSRQRSREIALQHQAGSGPYRLGQLRTREEQGIAGHVEIIQAVVA